MSSHIFNIQNSINVTGAIQGVQAGFAGESRVQHANALREQEAARSAERERISSVDQDQATIDLSHNESSQRAVYQPLPRKRRGDQAPEEDQEKQEGDGQQPAVKHIDITI